MFNNVTNLIKEDVKLPTEYPEVKGYLEKWTNYIHGWQKRWIILKNGALSYYKFENETGCGCRGVIHLYKAFIKAHDIDPYRFDVIVNDNAWYLRASSLEEKQHWIEALNYSKLNIVPFCNNHHNFKKNDSSKSLSNLFPVSPSNTLLNFQITPELKSALVEINTLKNSLYKQLDSIQCSVENFHINPDNKKSPPVIDLEVNVMSCKATVQNISEILQNCIELIKAREDALGKCVRQEEVEKQIKMEEEYQESILPKNEIIENQDQIHDENKIDNNAVKPECELLNVNEQNEVDTKASLYENKIENPYSALLNEVEKITNEQVHCARMGIGKDGWQLFAEEGEMKMYKREEELNGVAVDPLKACHFVRGFTAHEICNYFFKPEYRYEWETTLDANGMTVLESINENTLIFHQMHKRIWPTSQRDAVFWSHIQQVPNDISDNESVYNSWVVVNNSTDVKSHPPNINNLVRITMTVCLFCQTIILNQSKSISELKRSDIACKIIYCSVVNPGGWAPTIALRQIYKKEYPRFLRKFTSYVLSKTKDKPILF